MARRAYYHRLVSARVAARNRKLRNPEVWMQRARYLTKLRRRNEANKWLNRIVHHFPKSQQAVDARDMLAYGQGRSRSR